VEQKFEQDGTTCQPDTGLRILEAFPQPCMHLEDRSRILYLTHQRKWWHEGRRRPIELWPRWPRPIRENRGLIQGAARCPIKMHPRTHRLRLTAPLASMPAPGRNQNKSWPEAFHALIFELVSKAAAFPHEHQFMIIDHPLRVLPFRLMRYRADQMDLRGQMIHPAITGPRLVQAFSIHWYGFTFCMFGSGLASDISSDAPSTPG